MTQKKAAFSDIRNHQIILELKSLRISASEIVEVFIIFVKVWGMPYFVASRVKVSVTSIRFFRRTVVTKAHVKFFKSHRATIVCI